MDDKVYILVKSVDGIYDPEIFYVYAKCVNAVLSAEKLIDEIFSAFDQEGIRYSIKADTINNIEDIWKIERYHQLIFSADVMIRRKVRHIEFVIYEKEIR